MGNNFHLMAYRYFQGIDPGITEDVEGYEELDRWVSSLMRNFKKEEKKGIFQSISLECLKEF